MVIVAGPFPDPRHGMAIATEATAEVLNADIRLDLSAGGVSGSFGSLAVKLLNIVKALVWLLVRGRPNAALVAAVDSGEGMFVTLAIVLIGRLRSMTVTLQHHTWAYLDEQRLAMRWICALGGPRLRHIFLCERASIAFADTYHLTTGIHVVGNAFAISPSETSEVTRSGLVIGHLGNLSADKGIEDVVRAASVHTDVAFLVAGPATDDVAVRALAELSKLENVELRGRLDHGGVMQFHRETDVFLLPSRTEAMPLVVWEALGAGSRVISYDVGCISAMAQAPYLQVAQDADGFHDLIAHEVARQRVSASASDSGLVSWSLEDRRQRDSDDLRRLILGER